MATSVDRLWMRGTFADMGHLRENLHTHTWRCKHATGEVIDYARCARDAGMELLGVSDHTPLPDDRWLHVRMEMDKLDGYLAAFDPARAAVPGLPIFAGLECEPFCAYETFFRDELLKRWGVDYLVCGCHWIDDPAGTGHVVFRDLKTPQLMRIYADTLCRAMESGLYLFIAHPDAFGGSRDLWDDDCRSCARDICATAARTGVPLELNSYGLRKPPHQTSQGERPAYPWPAFWEVAADYDLRAICSSDAHTPEEVALGADELAAIIDAYGLQQVSGRELLAGP